MASSRAAASGRGPIRRAGGPMRRRAESDAPAVQAPLARRDDGAGQMRQAGSPSPGLPINTPFSSAFAFSSRHLRERRVNGIAAHE
jgi:hypothetical protein